MPNADPISPATPSLAQAASCFVGIILIIAPGLVLLQIDLHVLLFACLCWSALHAAALGYRYADIRGLMAEAINRALPALYIFLLIGMVIASFMHSVSIATLMHLWLGWLSPGLFLAIGMVLCAVMSLATGTSWGTVGTLGVVFIGIGDTLGLAPGLVAGMVVCGATFGDKMSPVSDTTNLAAMSAGTNLYRHIYAMLFTTVPSFLLALLVFAFIGMTASSGALSREVIDATRLALETGYGLNPLVTLLPIVCLATLSIRRQAAEVAMTASIVTAVLIAMVYQQQDPVKVLNALWQNSPGTTGIPNLDELLGRGGIASMSWTFLLAIMALALGGILHGARFLDVLLSGIISRVRRPTHRVLFGD